MQRMHRLLTDLHNNLDGIIKEAMKCSVQRANGFCLITDDLIDAREHLQRAIKVSQRSPITHDFPGDG